MMLLVSQWTNTRVSHPLHQDGVAQGTAGLLVHHKPLHVERLGHLRLHTHTHISTRSHVSHHQRWRSLTHLRAEVFPEALVGVVPHAGVLTQEEALLRERTQHLPQHLHQLLVRETVVRPAHVHLTHTQRMMGNWTGASWMIIYVGSVWPWRSRAGAASSSAAGWSSSGPCECPASPRRWSPWAPGPSAHTCSARSAGPARSSGSAAQKHKPIYPLQHYIHNHTINTQHQHTFY